MNEDEQRRSGAPGKIEDSETVSSAEARIESVPASRRSAGRPALLLALAAVGWNFAKGLILRPTKLDRRVMEVEKVPAIDTTGRDADRVEESESEFERRQRSGTWLVAFAYFIAIAGGFGFMFIYWTGGSNMLLGGTLALSLGGFGMALVLTAHWLTLHKQAMEPREQLPSSPKEREETLAAFCNGVHDVRRRRMLQWMGATGVGLFAAMIVSMFRSFGSSPDALFTTVWKPGQRLVTIGGKPISVNSLQPGSTMTVYPEDSTGSEKTQTVLVRVQEHFLQLPAGRENWAPHGYLAYSRVCTHAGCPVGLYESKTHLLLCPCHQSTFNVLNGAVPTGGPAARALPQLPLYVDGEGYLRAAAGFSAPPGPGFWGMPS